MLILRRERRNRRGSHHVWNARKDRHGEPLSDRRTANAVSDAPGDAAGTHDTGRIRTAGAGRYRVRGKDEKARPALQKLRALHSHSDAAHLRAVDRILS